MPAARSNGSVRRHSNLVHGRLLIEREAQRAGLQIIKWRGGKPVYRVKAGPKP